MIKWWFVARLANGHCMSSGPIDRTSTVIKHNSYFSEKLALFDPIFLVSRCALGELLSAPGNDNTL